VHSKADEMATLI